MKRKYVPSRCSKKQDQLASIPNTFSLSNFLASYTSLICDLRTLIQKQLICEGFTLYEEICLKPLAVSVRQANQFCLCFKKTLLFQSPSDTTDNIKNVKRGIWKSIQIHRFRTLVLRHYLKIKHPTILYEIQNVIKQQSLCLSFKFYKVTSAF